MRDKETGTLILSKATGDVVVTIVGEEKKAKTYANGEVVYFNVDNGRKPLGTGDPAGFQDHAKKGDSPYYGKKCVAQLSAEDDQTDRCIGTCDQHKDHHMIDLTKDTQRLTTDIQRVISGACSI